MNRKLSFLFLLFLSCLSASAATSTYEYVFNKSDLTVGTVSLNGVAWTCDHNLTGIRNNGTASVVLSGAGRYFLLACDNPWGRIVSVAVNISSKAGSDARLTVKVGEQTQTISTANTGTGLTVPYTLNFNASGSLSLRLDMNTTANVYVQKVAITYEAADLETITMYGDDASADNLGALQAHDGQTVNLVLNRAFRKREGYYSLCLPFALTQALLKAAFGDHAELCLFDHAWGDERTYRINFVTTDWANTLPAGTPFLLKISDADVSAPVFRGVTLNASVANMTIADANDFRVVGIYNPTVICDDLTNQRLYRFVSADGLNFVYPTTRNPLKGTRIYFCLPHASRQAKATLSVNGQAATGITLLPAQAAQADRGVYTLGGEHVGETLETMPAGIYIVGGKKLLKR